MSEQLLNQGPLPPTRGDGVDITRAEFIARGGRPFQADPMAGVANLDALCMDRWGNGYASRGFMHVSDHESAWRVVHPDVEPSWLDLNDSLYSGGALITQAARVAFERDGPPFSQGPEIVRYACLVYLFGTARGSRIFEGRERDPNNGAPLSAVQVDGKWTVQIGTKPPAPPVEPPPPPVEPPVPPIPPTPPVRLPMRPSARILETAQLAIGWVPLFRRTKRGRLEEVRDYLVELDKYLAEIEAD